MKKKNKNIKNNIIKDLLLNQKGMALLTTLIFVFILVTFGVALLSMTSNDIKLSALQRDSTKAFYIAEAGIQDAIGRLINGAVPDSEYEEADWNVGNIYSSTDLNNTFTIKHRLVAGNPTVVDTNPATGKPYYIINSTGTSGRSKRKIEVVISLTYTSAFAKALIGCNGVELNSNATTSSYSSTANPTDWQKGDVSTVNGDMILGSNTDIRGSVSVNGDLTMSSNVKIQKNAYANGDITLGDANIIGAGDTESPYTYEAIAGGSIMGGTIYGASISNADPLPVSSKPCDPLDIDDLFSTNAFPIETANNNGELIYHPFYDEDLLEYSISNTDTDTIGVAGENREYYLESFSTDSNSIVTVEGNVTLYVKGNFSMNSNSRIELAGGATLTIYVTENFYVASNTHINDMDLGNPGIPGNLIIYSNKQSTSNSDYQIILDSNTGFRGIVYAPRTSVQVNSNSSIHGAIRGMYVYMDSDGVFHYDEELGKITGGPDGYSLEYWREII